jgi:carbamoyltransferase
MSLIIGINAYHGDSAACIVRDGQLIAAVEEERFRRVKHWAGFPTKSIEYCLEAAGCNIIDVTDIAVNQDPMANRFKKIQYVLSHTPSPIMLWDRYKNKMARANIDDELTRNSLGGFHGKIHQIEHHLSHLSSAYYVSGFDHALAVSIDGFGDFASTAWGVGKGSDLSTQGRIFFPHSLGAFYQAITQWLGFPNYGDEYKVMGLAPYGSPKYLNKMREVALCKPNGEFELNLHYFLHQSEKIAHTWQGGAPVFSNLYSNHLSELLGPARTPNEPLTQFHIDIASSAQAMYEEAFFNLLDALYLQYGLNSLCLAGGCAMNSVANGKILSKTTFKRLYVQSAAGDAGGAIGAAFVVSKQDFPEINFFMDHAYWGPHFSNEQVKAVIDSHATTLSDQHCTVFLSENESDLMSKTAQSIADGKVVGWFQGQMEWGPRALGNRSILGDPRRADMKDILNLKIKRRESFRPFAPSILREHVKDWFERDDDVPFMMQVYPIREDKRSLIPAVCHVDGSGRLQTVYRTTNPRYHGLIEAFNKLTNVPMILNTSFNENEPVVCTPREALDCFLRTKMDKLVMGDWVISR